MRLRVLLLLMRWSGLRVSDGVRLERSRLVGDSILLYQAKTGTPLFCAIAPGGRRELTQGSTWRQTQSPILLLDRKWLPRIRR